MLGECCCSFFGFGVSRWMEMLGDCCCWNLFCLGFLDGWKCWEVVVGKLLLLLLDFFVWGF